MMVRKQSNLLISHCFFFIIHCLIVLIVKKSFYAWALKFHPDRVPENEKEEAAAKFSIIHSILSDSEKKKLYDDGNDVLFTKTTIAAQWEHYLKPMTNNDINGARCAYQGSESEGIDLIREFKIGNGSITHLLNTIPFMCVEDENRIIESVQNLMSLGRIPQKSVKKMKK